MKKFQFNKETGDFEIDPQHLVAGLTEAAKKKQTSIRITALDYRDKDLAFDADALSRQKWIKNLTLDDDLEAPEGFETLQRLNDLEELTTNEWGTLDYSKFKKLRALTLTQGTALVGLNKLRALRSLYLIAWKAKSLPKELSSCSATEVRISASSQLADVSPVFEMKKLSELTLQGLPKLKPGSEALHLDSLRTLNIEATPAWTDFRQLHSSSLRELELFTKAKSLGFIVRQLPVLRKLYVWEVIDGKMTPVAEHPRLREIYFDKNRKHNSHKEKELQTILVKKEAQGEGLLRVVRSNVAQDAPGMTGKGPQGGRVSRSSSKRTARKVVKTKSV